MTVDKDKNDEAFDAYWNGLPESMRDPELRNHHRAAFFSGMMAGLDRSLEIHQDIYGSIKANALRT